MTLNLKDTLTRAASHARGLVGDLALISRLCSEDMFDGSTTCSQELVWRDQARTAEKLCNGASHLAVAYAGGETTPGELAGLVRCIGFIGEVSGVRAMAFSRSTNSVSDGKLNDAIVGAHLNVTRLMEIHTELRVARAEAEAVGSASTFARTRTDIEADIAETATCLTKLRGKLIREPIGSEDYPRIQGEIREGKDAFHDLKAELAAFDDREAHRASSAA